MTIMYMRIIAEANAKESDSDDSPVEEEPQTLSPRQLRKKRSAAKKRESFTIAYGDGHDSHKTAAAKTFALQNKVQFRLLRSNNGTRDDPLDMGPNSKLFSYVDKATKRWRIQNRNAMITQYIWDGVFSEALINFKADPDLA